MEESPALAEQVVAVAPLAGQSENWAIAVPVRATVWVAGVALSVMTRLPVLAALPAPAGVKTMLNVQLAPILSVAGAAEQSFVCVKSPVMVNLVILSGAVPVLVSVTVWGEVATPKG